VIACLSSTKLCCIWVTRIWRWNRFSSLCTASSAPLIRCECWCCLTFRICWPSTVWDGVCFSLLSTALHVSHFRVSLRLCAQAHFSPLSTPTLIALRQSAATALRLLSRPDTRIYGHPTVFFLNSFVCSQHLTLFVCDVCPVWNLPLELESRGFDRSKPSPLPGYSYREHALWVWDALETYINRTVAAMYPDDAAVRADSELQRLITELYDPERAALP
jgi:hypothetical protein